MLSNVGSLAQHLSASPLHALTSSSISLWGTERLVWQSNGQVEASTSVLVPSDCAFLCAYETVQPRYVS
jgi:hypothetical protein